MKEWIYGRNAVYETLRAGRRKVYRLKIAQGIQSSSHIEKIQQIASEKKLPLDQVPRRELDGLAEAHQGVVLQTDEYPYVSFSQLVDRPRDSSRPPFFLLLDTLQDPQNLGTLLRTAEAVGVHGVLLPQRRTATVTPAVVNASSGACEHLWIAQYNLAQAINELKKSNVWVIGLEGGEDGQPLDKVRLDGPLALVVGNEGEGMRRLVRDTCDLLLKLPMQGKIESLNAAVAGSIALFLAWQARGFK